MEDPIFFHVYVSAAVELFSPADLLDLLKVSRENNGRAGVTGLLLYKGGNFMQVLEGERATVERVAAKVRRDRRHHGLVVLLEGYSAERQFEQWGMGFRDLNSPEVRQTPGFSEFMNVSLSAREFGEDVHLCQRLLLSFKNQMR